MSDDTTITEGSVKFREGKKWKPRWCALRKLSPVADCVHLEVYGDRGERAAGRPARSVLPLQQYAGYEAGFVLAGETHALAVLCGERVAVLAAPDALELRRWTDALRDVAGEPARFRVLVPGAGPGRLLVLRGRLSLAAGCPPRLLGSWPLRHVRRFGAVRGRFAFEAGSRCGAGAGARAVVSEQAAEIARAVATAAGAGAARGDGGGVRGGARLERCASCVSRLDAGGFAPAWTMDGAPDDLHYDVPRTAAELDGEYYDTPKRINDYLNDETFRMPKSSTVDALVRRVDDWLQPSAVWYPAGAPGALYATVDVRRKEARAASSSRAHDYENAGVLRECRADYLPMCAAGYAAMTPAPRASSIPALDADWPDAELAPSASLETLRSAPLRPQARAARSHDRDSSGSTDSGVWSCTPPRPPRPPRPPPGGAACAAAGARGGAGAVADSRSTSSGTSDMSDYMETLSLSSEPSWEAPRPR